MPAEDHKRSATVWIAIAALCLLATACGPGPASRPTADPAANPNATADLRGDLIVPLAPSNAPSTSPPTQLATSLPTVRTSPPPALPPNSNPQELLPLSFDTLSSFLYQVRAETPDGEDGKPALVTDDTIPEYVQALDGRRIVIDGFVMPLRTQGRGVTQFLLARDQLSCCFGPSPQMNHWIQVTLPRGEFRPLIFRPATVTGTLWVGELKLSGSIQSIYRLEGERAEYLPEAPPAAASPALDP